MLNEPSTLPFEVRASFQVLALFQCVLATSSRVFCFIYLLLGEGVYSWFLDSNSARFIGINLFLSWFWMRKICFLLSFCWIWFGFYYLIWISLVLPLVVSWFYELFRLMLFASGLVEVSLCGGNFGSLSPFFWRLHFLFVAGGGLVSSPVMLFVISRFVVFDFDVIFVFLFFFPLSSFLFV